MIKGQSIKECIEYLASELLDGRLGQTHEAFIGVGASFCVFEFEVDGELYAAKSSKSTIFKALRNAPHTGVIIGSVLCDPDFKQFARSIEHGCERAKNIRGMEQFVGYFPEEQFLVTRRLPGSTFKKLSTEEFSAISKSHLQDAFETLINARKAGIIFDHHSGNLLFDPTHGFGFIDYIGGNNVPRSAMFDIDDFATLVVSASRQELDSPDPLLKYLDGITRMQSCIRILEDCKAISRELFTLEEVDHLEKQINFHIEDLQIIVGRRKSFLEGNSGVELPPDPTLQRELT